MSTALKMAACCLRQLRGTKSKFRKQTQACGSHTHQIKCYMEFMARLTTVHIIMWKAVPIMYPTVTFLSSKLSKW